MYLYAIYFSLVGKVKNIINNELQLWLQLWGTLASASSITSRSQHYIWKWKYYASCSEPDSKTPVSNQPSFALSYYKNRRPWLRHGCLCYDCFVDCHIILPIRLHYINIWQLQAKEEGSLERLPERRWILNVF